MTRRFLIIKEIPADNDVPLMAQAAASVGQIGIKDAGPLLALMAQRVKASMHNRDPKKFLSNEASVATFVSGAKLAEPGVLPEARRMLAVGVEAGQDYEVRSSAGFALAWLTDPADGAANATLLKVAGTKGGAPAVEAIKALLRRGAPGALDTLRVVATSSFDPAARFAAHQAVERLTGERRTYVPTTRPLARARRRSGDHDPAPGVKHSRVVEVRRRVLRVWVSHDLLVEPHSAPAAVEANVKRRLRAELLADGAPGPAGSLRDVAA